ncbi:hypothetical protein [Vibrio sp. MEBiC08052]|uniref:hypothetical protein n=1 Tax=Vibrio sp. MEBiC08052 TaxID=1761910 RepID=UPI0007408513|nr:hypothetical protein [Vibrio sp. MEBiC08052]KUI98199.1 hypothetical protein VRK_29000 [Vibrio sp. MEBiC08052]
MNEKEIELIIKSFLEGAKTMSSMMLNKASTQDGVGLAVYNSDSIRKLFLGVIESEQTKIILKENNIYISNEDREKIKKLIMLKNGLPILTQGIVSYGITKKIAERVPYSIAGYVLSVASSGISDHMLKRILNRANNPNGNQLPIAQSNVDVAELVEQGIQPFEAALRIIEWAVNVAINYFGSWWDTEVSEEDSIFQTLLLTFFIIYQLSVNKWQGASDVLTDLGFYLMYLSGLKGIDDKKEIINSFTEKSLLFTVGAILSLIGMMTKSDTSNLIRR